MPIGTTAAIIAATVVGGATALYQGSQASKAAKAGVKAAEAATDKELEMYYKSLEISAPWRETGEEALNLLSEKIKAGPGEFKPEEDPGYKFGYEEALEPVLRGGAAAGRLGGGRTLTELSRKSMGYAGQRQENFLQRWYRSLQPLAEMAGMGRAESQAAAGMTMNVGRDIGQNLLTAGEARKTGYVNKANIAGGFASGVGQNLLDVAYMKKYGKTATGTPT